MWASAEVLPKDFNFTAEVPIHVGDPISVIPYFRPGSPELAEHVVEAMAGAYRKPGRAHTVGVAEKFGNLILIVCHNVMQIIYR